MKNLLLVTPPFTQLNTPYPATAYLKGFLNTKGISAYQMDLGLEVILALFSKNGMEAVFEEAHKQQSIKSANARRIFSLRANYLQVIDEVIGFLQGTNPTFARQLSTENFLPRASRFETLDDIEYAFGIMGMQDKAKHYATLFLEDLSDFIIECVDSDFGFSRYAERLGQSANSFDALYGQLTNQPTYIDTLTLRIFEQTVERVNPKLICFSVPFPGNLYSAFRCAQWIKTHKPAMYTAMGGGFPNTELRSLKDPRVFDFMDYITLDDGERPIELLVSHVLDPSPANPDHGTFKRTYYRQDGAVVFTNNSTKQDYKQQDVGTPDYSDLYLDRYISVIEMTNPMHSLWSDGRWNKLTMAHGCYWGKCTFCDVSLDYIKIYEPIAAKTLVDRMESLIQQTGTNGFHFVDEAAPPALMRALALEIIRRRLTVTWWTNIRFEKSFTLDLCRLLKASGCIAVSGGLEVASDRLLALIEKGVTVSQVARVTRNFTESHIMVHAYLMYGYPTQTVQETVDSLEMVRQLFEEGVIQSGFWHQFALTSHSPIGLEPERYAILPHKKDITFADNEVAFTDKTGIDHGKFSFGLKKSLFNFMHGIGFEMKLQEWFDFKIPRTTIAPDFIATCLAQDEDFLTKPTAKIVWIGSEPEVSVQTRTKKGKSKRVMVLVFHTPEGEDEVVLDQERGDWVMALIKQSNVCSGKPLTFEEVKVGYEQLFGDIAPFWYSKPVYSLREAGLLVL
ncbi:MAG: radical SAM protein [Alphaproteobacteria bacterium]|nr:radical SAM protein [Alphaproteobacteria bacterium]